MPSPYFSICWQPQFGDGRGSCSEHKVRGISMAEHLPIFLRAHTEVVRLAGSSRETPKKTRPNPLEHKKINICKWPEYALVFDCETTTDTRQALTFGSFRFCCVDIASNYRCIEEGIFCDELSEADPEALAVLRGYARTAEAETLEGFTRKMRLLSRSDFMELVFWKAADRAEALVVG